MNKEQIHEQYEEDEKLREDAACSESMILTAMT